MQYGYLLVSPAVVQANVPKPTARIEQVSNGLSTGQIANVSENLEAIPPYLSRRNVGKMFVYLQSLPASSSRTRKSIRYPYDIVFIFRFRSTSDMW